MTVEKGGSQSVGLVAACADERLFGSSDTRPRLAAKERSAGRDDDVDPDSARLDARIRARQEVKRRRMRERLPIDRSARAKQISDRRTREIEKARKVLVADLGKVAKQLDPHAFYDTLRPAAAVETAPSPASAISTVSILKSSNVSIQSCA